MIIPCIIATYQTTNPGASSNTQVRIPAGNSDAGYYIYWEEVGNPSNNGSLTGNGTQTITFPIAGLYRVGVKAGSGTFSKIQYSNSPNKDKDKIITIEQWGTTVWDNFDVGYYGCTNMCCLPHDVPDLSESNSLYGMFWQCASMLDDSVDN